MYRNVSDQDWHGLVLPSRRGACLIGCTCMTFSSLGTDLDSCDVRPFRHSTAERPRCLVCMFMY